VLGEQSQPCEQDPAPCAICRRPGRQGWHTGTDSAQPG
jgi:hypothetical protein